MDSQLVNLICTNSASEFHSLNLYSNSNLAGIYLVKFLLEDGLGFDLSGQELKHCLVHSRDRKYFILNSDEMAIRTTIRTDNLIIGGTSSYFKSEENEMNSLAHSLNIYMNGEAPFVFEAPYTIITTPASSMNIERVLRADKILDPGSNDTLWERKARYNVKELEVEKQPQGIFNVLFSDF